MLFDYAAMLGRTLPVGRSSGSSVCSCRCRTSTATSFVTSTHARACCTRRFLRRRVSAIRTCRWRLCLRCAIAARIGILTLSLSIESHQLVERVTSLTLLRVFFRAARSRSCQSGSRSANGYCRTGTSTWARRESRTCTRNRRHSLRSLRRDVGQTDASQTLSVSLSVCGAGAESREARRGFDWRSRVEKRSRRARTASTGRVTVAVRNVYKSQVLARLRQIQGPQLAARAGLILTVHLLLHLRW